MIGKWFAGLVFFLLLLENEKIIEHWLYGVKKEKRKIEGNTHTHYFN